MPPSQKEKRSGRNARRQPERNDTKPIWSSHFRLASLRSSFNRNAIPTYAVDKVHHEMRHVTSSPLPIVVNSESRDDILHASAVNLRVSRVLLRDASMLSDCACIEVMVIVLKAWIDSKRTFSRHPVVGQLIFSSIDLLSSSDNLPLELKIWVLFTLIPLAPICERQRDALQILYNYCSRLGLIECGQVERFLRRFCDKEGLPHVSCSVLWLEIQRRFSIIQGGFSHHRRCLSTSSR